MSIRLWIAKYYHNQVSKWKRIKFRCDYWIQYYDKRRQRALNRLNIKEFLEFGVDTGYMPPHKKHKVRK